MTLTPERRFVIRILRSFLRVPGAEAGLPAFPSAAGWDRLLALLRFHRLIPVACRVFSKEGLLASLPPTFAGALKEGTRESSARSLFLEAHLQSLGEAFHRRNIPFIVLKGPAIAQEYYDPPYLRPYGDLDILIRFNDFDRAGKLLGERGFVPEDPTKVRFIDPAVKAVPLMNALIPGLSVDLQWETVTLYWGRKPFLSGEDTWRRVHEIGNGGGASFLGLDPTLLLPYLCVHLMSHHHFSPLISLVDIGLIVQEKKRPVDWEAVLTLAGEQGIGSALYYPLRFLRDPLGLAVPAPVLEALKPGVVTRGLFPAERLALRSQALTVWAERAVKFFLIDDWAERVKALGTFYRYRVRRRPGSGK